MKKWKRVLLYCFIVIGGIGISGIAVFQYYVKPKYVKPLVNAAASFFESEEDVGELVAILQKELRQSDLSGRGSAEEVQSKAYSGDVKWVEQGAVNQSVSEEEKTSDTKQTNTKQTSDKKTSKQEISSSDMKVGGKSVAELEKQVSMKDKTEGIKIAAKINTAYLIGLTKDGISEREKEDAKKHLKQVLTQQEYEKLKELVGKYAYLLNN